MIDQSRSVCATLRTAWAGRAVQSAVPERLAGSQNRMSHRALHERGVVASPAVDRQLRYNDAHRGIGAVAHDQGVERYLPLRSDCEQA